MSTSGGGTPAVPTGPAGGDLSGGYPAPVVAQVQGRPVSNAAPAGSQAFVWNGALWLPSAIVNNFAGRTGGIVPTTGDYTAAQVTGAADKSAVAAQAFAATVTAPLLSTSNGINLAIGLTGVVNPCIYYDGNFMYLSVAAGKGVKTPGGGNTLDDGAGNVSIAGDHIAWGSNGALFDKNGAQTRLYSNTAGVSLWSSFIGGTVLDGGGHGLFTSNSTLDDGTGNLKMAGAIFPGNNGVQSTCALLAGAGAPNNAVGANGSYFFRSDTPTVANQRIYVKSAGVWVGIV